MTNENIAEKREQVAKQCQVVAHLARVLADVESMNADMVREKRFEQILDLIGSRTAHMMEVLGDVLNGIDAVDEEQDGWMEQVFEEAQRRWPQV